MAFTGTVVKLQLSHGEHERESDAKLANETFQELFTEESWGDVEVYYENGSYQAGLLIASSSALKDLTGEDREAAEGRLQIRGYDCVSTDLGVSRSRC